MSPRFLGVFFFLLAVSVSNAADGIKIVRVWPAWHDAEYFQRVSEYFGGPENTSGQIVLRTQPSQRAGFYFLARTKNLGGTEISSVKIILEVIKPGLPDPVTYTFESPPTKGDAVYQIGLTGTDWSGPRVHPVAWRLRIFDAQGGLLATEKSFLWDIPAK
ncbi:MAG TPA: hypothetical protein VKC60_13500 [Opitutaceae bacterium]|nr:hypothetical protein [Opitutaceae bacterium]